jgi:glycosyltransferase involved in cell wall biosynthesis
MPSMIARKIGFVHPPLESFPSGGNVYNKKLLEYAGHCGFPLVSLPWRDEALPCGNWDLLAWDSLYLDRLARIAGERIAVLLHCLPSLEPALDLRGKQALQAVEQRAVAQADFAIATGKTVAETVTARWPGKPVFLCEPGVGEAFLRDRPGRADQPVTLLTVAHLLPAKGHGELLELLQQLRHLHWHWQVAGDCGLSPETVRRLRDRAAQAGLTDRITFHGALQQEAVAALMANSDLLVFPSTFEAYGMAVAEAAAAGLPVLGNRVGAAAQLIQHGVTGFLATAGDWDSFGGYLQVLLEDAALRAAFRDNLRHAAVRGWDKTFADFRAACEAMLR